MPALAIVIIAVLTIMVVGLGNIALNYRVRVRRAQDERHGSPIPLIPLEQFDPVFAHGPFGPTTAAEVRLLGEGDGVPGGTTDRETWILAALAKRAACLFEFGTCTGKTAYLWAVNSKPTAMIRTLTLRPSDRPMYESAPGDSAEATEFALNESAFAEFLYTDTAAAAKITQLYGDSKHFDESLLAGQCDLIFIDGSHASSYVKSDTAKALRMVAPGGVILWHDYRGPTGTTKDVFNHLNVLCKTRSLVRFAHTSLVAYRAPAGAPRDG
ncbi:MAG: class I SAM-dependent methyltransferase [Gemmatimonadales bacterium]